MKDRTSEAEIHFIFKNAQPGLEKWGSYPGIGVNWATLHGRCVVLRVFREMGAGL